MPRSVDSFPHEYIVLLLKATEEPITFKMKFREAVSNRQALHTLRQALKREHHPAYTQAKDLEIIIRPTKAEPDDPVELTIRSRSYTDFALLVRTTLGSDADMPTDGIPPVDLQSFVAKPTIPLTDEDYVNAAFIEEDDADEV